jgi:hypothetical protein
MHPIGTDSYENSYMDLIYGSDDHQLYGSDDHLFSLVVSSGSFTSDLCKLQFNCHSVPTTTSHCALRETRASTGFTEWLSKLP